MKIHYGVIVAWIGSVGVYEACNRLINSYGLATVLTVVVYSEPCGLKTNMAQKRKVNKVVKFNKLYYNIYGLKPFYMRGKIPYQDEMVKQNLITVRQLPGDVLEIRLTGARKLLQSIKLNMEDQNGR